MSFIYEMKESKVKAMSGEAEISTVSQENEYYDIASSADTLRKSTRVFQKDV